MTHERAAIAVVLLAAGASARMGRPKQLLVYCGRSLLQHAAEQAIASGCAPVLVVLGAEAERLECELEALPVELVWNNHWEEGMASSIRAGIEALDPAVAAAVLMLCDQPHVSAGLLRRLAEQHRRGVPIVACEYDGTLGVPALFDRSLFPALLALEGDRGAKKILARHAPEAIRIPFPEGVIDLDTSEDYENLSKPLGPALAGW